ncbi:6477_t:CDS:2, partial [Gigaspora margarita]
MKQQRTILPGRRRSNNGICSTSDDYEKPFYTGSIVEIVDFLWDFESLKKAMVKEVVEIEEKINKAWSIKQKDNKSILTYTYCYKTLVALVKGLIKDYEEMYWYIFGLHKQYRWRVEI